MSGEASLETELRVLVLPPTRRDGEVTQALLASNGLASVVCSDVRQLAHELRVGAGAALLTVESLLADGVVELIAALANQPSWSDLPVVLLGDKQKPSDAGDLEFLRNVTLLERPTSVRSVVSTLQTAVRARRRQYQIRDHIAASVQAELHARELQEQLAIALEASELGTFHCPMPLGRIQWNGQCKAHFGLPADAEIDFELFYSLIHPDDRDRTRMAVEECVGQGKHYDIEYRVLLPEGKIRWIRATGRTYFDRDHRPIRFDGTTADITLKKQDEERLRQAEQQSRDILESITDGFFAVDREWRFTYANPQAGRLVDKVSAELLGKSLWEQFPGTLGSDFERIHRRAMDERIASSATAFYADLDRWFEVHSYPAAYGISIYFRDVSKRQLAEAALLESRERFEAMANSIPQLAWMAKPDGWLFWYNQRWHSYCGTTPEAMEGWGWQTVHDPQELPRVIESWQASLASGEPWESLFPLRRFDGEYRWHLSRAMPFRDKSGEILFWFGTNTDITDERNRAENKQRLLEAEQAARAEAERVSQMKDEFLATLSHELRTPLSAIFGWTQLLKMDQGNPQTIQDGIEVIDRNVRLQTRLIEDLLDMSRIISGKVRLDVQRIDLPQLIHAAIDSVQLAADAKMLRLEKIIDPLAGPVSGDPGRLQQVLWNLLTNAIKFTPKGGKIQIVAAQVNSHVEVRIADTGEGISPSFLPYLFERFSQSDASITRKHGGLGLGLSIVKNLVELHGGKIEALSDGEGLGSTFIVHLPLRAADTATDRLTHPRATLAAPKFDVNDRLSGLKVLVVDDEPDARDLIRRFLVGCGATASLAGSAAEAQSQLAAFQPNVIISDIGMPGQDGYEFIRNVRRNGDRTPAVALTAFARAEDRIRSIQAGYQTHLPKPVEPAELVAVVASLAGRL